MCWQCETPQNTKRKKPEPMEFPTLSQSSTLTVLKTEWHQNNSRGAWHGGIALRQEPNYQMVWPRTYGGGTDLCRIWLPYTYYTVMLNGYYGHFAYLTQVMMWPESLEYGQAAASAPLPNMYNYGPCMTYPPTDVTSTSIEERILITLAQFWSSYFSWDGNYYLNPVWKELRKLSGETDLHTRGDTTRVFQTWEKLTPEEVKALPWKQGCPDEITPGKIRFDWAQLS